MTAGCSRCSGKWRPDLTPPLAPRHLRRMRLKLTCALVGGLAVLAAPAVTAQRAVQLTAGATSSGTIVNDGVLLTKLRPAIAPTVGVAIAIPTGGGPYRVRLEADVASSALNATTGGTTYRLSTLTTITALVMAEGPLLGDVRWQLGGGAIFYRPSENQGVFLDGPTRRWLVAAGAVYSRQLTPALSLIVNGRIDAHSFVTDVLRARNYAGSQGVERYTLQLGIQRKL